MWLASYNCCYAAVHQWPQRHAVQSGRLRSAALDVLSAEPRILITPHAAWYSEEAMIDMRARGADEVVRVLSGQKPRVPVNAPDPARG